MHHDHCGVLLSGGSRELKYPACAVSTSLERFGNTLNGHKNMRFLVAIMLQRGPYNNSVVRDSLL